MELNFKNNKINELRIEKGLSQQALANKLETSQANLSRWEKGDIVPSVIECWKLANFFEVSIDVICGRKEY